MIRSCYYYSIWDFSHTWIHNIMNKNSSWFQKKKMAKTVDVNGHWIWCCFRRFSSFTLLFCCNFRPTFLLLFLFLDSSIIFLLMRASLAKLFSSNWAYIFFSNESLEPLFSLTTWCTSSRSSPFFYAMLVNSLFIYLFIFTINIFSLGSISIWMMIKA